MMPGNTKICSAVVGLFNPQHSPEMGDEPKKRASRLSCPSCGCGKAKFKRLSSKCVLTTVGEMTVAWRYYVCGVCGASHTPQT